MEVRFHFEIPRSFVVQGTLGYIRPMCASLPFQNVLACSRTDISRESRSFPFRIRSSQQIEVWETLQMPAGWKLDNAPGLESVDGSGASFHGRVEQNVGVVSIREKLELKKRIYPAEDWKSFRNSVVEFRKVAERPFLFSKGGAK